MEPSSSSPKGDSVLTGLLLLFGVVLLIQVIGGFAIYSFFEEWGDRGTFGDMFGAVNTLFSGLAFAGVIYAILLQRQELRLQREELELTRNELAKSAEAQQSSSEALRQQLDLMQASASREEARLLADSRVILQFETRDISERRGDDTNAVSVVLSVVNVGSTGSDFEIIPTEDFRVFFVGQQILPTNQRAKVSLLFPVGTDGYLHFDIYYQDVLGRRRFLQYEFDVLNNTVSLLAEGVMSHRSSQSE